MGASPKLQSRIEFQNIAYRGASGLAPENTLRACDLAIRHGATTVHVNVRLSRDGMPVLFHDEEVSRLTGGKGRVGDMTGRELRSLKVQGGRGRRVFADPVATLEELILLSRGRCDLALELMSHEGEDLPIARAVLELGAKYRLPPSTSLLAYSYKAFRNLRSLRPPYKVGRILGPRCGWQKVIESVRDQPHLLVVHRAAASPKALAACRQGGVRVWIYTIEHAKEFQRAVALRPEGIVSPYPGRMRRYLERLVPVGS
jgi:glycerophosphoryl diester phosphodiesterase